MKAILLAAGLGTRLRPLTQDLPKCLLPVGGKPLLGIWMELLRDYGITEVLVNTHYLAEAVRDFAMSWKGVPKLQLSHEDELLGSAGTLERNWDFVSEEDDFLVCNADNLTDINLRKFIQFHHSHCGLATLCLFHADLPSECGIVDMDESGRILAFEEKPALPKSNLANGGIYIFRNEIRTRFPHRKPSDIGRDLLPGCLGETYGWLWKGLLIDIGNPNSYFRANQTWSHQRSRPVMPSLH